MEKNNKILVVLVIILGVLVLGLGGYVVYDKVLNTDNDDVSTGNEEDTGNDEVNDYVQYSFGDIVVISKMAEVTDFYYDGSLSNFSKWYVLSDKDNIVTLYSDEVWGKGSSASDYKSVFSDYDVTIEEMRGLDVSELELFGCDVSSMTCNDVPSFAKSSLTSVVSEKSVIIFDGDKLFSKDFDEVLAAYRPVIVITKSNLESAK